MTLYDYINTILTLTWSTKPHLLLWSEIGKNVAILRANPLFPIDRDVSDVQFSAASLVLVRAEEGNLGVGVGVVSVL